MCKKKTTPKKIGRPSKFDSVSLDLIRHLYESGYTDKQVATKIDVSEVTLNAWKKKNPEFLKSLKDWKIEADKDVEASLYQRARGYTTKETKVFCDKFGKITEHTISKHYAPDPTSMIFWLKNRQPDKWRDRKEIDLGNQDGKDFKFAFDLEKLPTDE